jgi:hypothetical protein
MHVIARSSDMSGFIRDFKTFTSKEIKKNIMETEPQILRSLNCLRRARSITSGKIRTCRGKSGKSGTLPVLFPRANRGKRDYEPGRSQSIVVEDGRLASRYIL